MANPTLSVASSEPAHAAFARRSLHLFTLVAALGLATGCGGGSGGGGGAGDDASADAKTGDAAGDVSVDGAASDGGASDAVGDAGSDAGADAKTGDAAATCSVPEIGACNGAVLTYCSDEGDQTFDCATMVADLPATCTLLSDDWGHDCALPPGAPCVYETEDGEPSWDFCDGKGAACVSGAETDVCKAGVGTCSDDDIETCMGDHAIRDCAAGHAWTLDCASFGGTCSDGEDGASCTGLAKGSACDDVYLVCADGLGCAVEDGEDTGVCE